MSIQKVISGFTGALFAEIRGGWKTVGAPGPAALDSGEYGNDSLYPFVGMGAAMKLPVVLACAKLRAENIAAMPLHIRDRKKGVAVDHDLYYLLHDSPNYYQTNLEYTSADVFKTDMMGNSYSHIKRRRDKSVKSLEPIDLSIGVTPKFKNDRLIYDINGEDYDAESILHQKGFSTDGYTGLSLLNVGREVLSAQVTSNSTAMRTFKNQLKIGGFFQRPQGAMPLTSEQHSEFQRRMLAFNNPSNQSQWLPLPPGYTPVDGSQYRISMADAQLLESRYFGIEEICRLFNVPPPLIGHTDKASSWASSVEALNMHYLTYSLMPTLIRREKRYAMQLLSPEERRLYFPRYSVEGLLRADTKSRFAFYASALQNGWMSINEVRDMEDRVGIGAYGDEFRVQLNMAQANAKTDGDEK